MRNPWWWSTGFPFRVGAHYPAPDAPNTFFNRIDDGSLPYGEILAQHGPVAKLVPDRPNRRTAIASRDLISQSKGIIMERFQIDAVQA